jgi:hypothetical protein
VGSNRLGNFFPRKKKLLLLLKQLVSNSKLLKMVILALFRVSPKFYSLVSRLLSKHGLMKSVHIDVGELNTSLSPRQKKFYKILVKDIDNENSN